MKIKTITYHKVFNLGNYNNEKIGCELELSETDDPVKCHMEAVQYVEHAHKFQTELPKYFRCKEIVRDPRRYTGYDVETSAEYITHFELQYSKFLSAYSTDEQRALAVKMEAEPAY